MGMNIYRAKLVGRGGRGKEREGGIMRQANK